MCRPLLVLLIGLLLAGCSGSLPEPAPVPAPTVPMKNGVPLTATQIREQQEYIERARRKQAARKAEAARQSQLRIMQESFADLEWRRQRAEQGRPVDPPGGTVAAVPDPTPDYVPAASRVNVPAPPSIQPDYGAPPLPTTDAQAEVVGVRLAPIQTAQGRWVQEVLTDWRNAGNVPIRVVFAEITAYDAAGTELSSSAPDYCIFAGERSTPSIAPGEIYREPRGKGFMLLGLPGEGEPVRATVRILRARSRSALD